MDSLGNLAEVAPIRPSHLPRVCAVGVAIAIYGLAFFPLFHVVGPAAFLLGVIPGVTSGGLLGVWGGVIAVLVTTAMDCLLAVTGNILLIDDEAAVRVVTNRLLTDLGQHVITADSGRRGLELFAQHQSTIDLVLLDLTMPELSGAEVLQELRHIRNDVQVVVTSGFHPSNAHDLLTSPNVVGFLEKPHNMANLEAIVATIFAD
jgi:CheY-like chemotaxis protein